MPDACYVVCETPCQSACQTCNVFCNTGLCGSCQAACQQCQGVPCQTCQGCQGAACESVCQNCQGVACQTCQVCDVSCNSCQTTCEKACQNCQGASCQTCQSGCETICQNCQGAACQTCQGCLGAACQTCQGCLGAVCQSVCQTVCQVACQSCNAGLVVRPPNFVWTSLVVKDGKISLAAAEWNLATKKINAFRVYKSLPQLSFTTVVADTPITAAIYNEAAIAMVDLGPYLNGYTVPPQKSATVSFITADDLIKLRDAMNSIS